MIELVIRVRCQTCSNAFEQMKIPQGLPLPANLTLTLADVPKGWTRDGDATFCPEHPQRLVEVAPAMRGLKVVR